MIDPNKLAWKGTPYPWNVQVNNAHDIWVKNNDRSVALCAVGFPNNASEWEDNAHVIAAAPEAVELLSDILEWHDNQVKNVKNIEDLYFMPQIMIDRIETVLKKAYNF